MINFHAKIDFKHNLFENGSLCQNRIHAVCFVRTVIRNTSLFSRKNKKQKLVTKKDPKKHVS